MGLLDAPMLFVRGLIMDPKCEHLIGGRGSHHQAEILDFCTFDHQYWIVYELRATVLCGCGCGRGADIGATVCLRQQPAAAYETSCS